MESAIGKYTPERVHSSRVTTDARMHREIIHATTPEQIHAFRTLCREYAASLLYADNRIYCFSQQGKVTVLKPSGTFEVLARNELADGFMASPAVDGKALILRTKTNLYRIEETAPPVKP